MKFKNLRKSKERCKKCSEEIYYYGSKNIKFCKNCGRLK